MTKVEKFAKCMNEIATGHEALAGRVDKRAAEHDADQSHLAAEELMCDLLKTLGYGQGVKVFLGMYKWFPEVNQRTLADASLVAAASDTAAERDRLSVSNAQLRELNAHLLGVLKKIEAN